MGIISSIVDECRATWVSAGPPRDPVIAKILGTGDNAAGVSVNEDTALNFSAVWAGTRIIAETIATLPLFLYREVGGRTEKVDGHRSRYLVDSEPNDEMTAYMWRETQCAHVCNWGNCYSEIEHNQRGDAVFAIHLITPDRVEMDRRENGDLFYRVHPDPDMRKGRSRELNKVDMFHVLGLSFNGLQGLSVVGRAMHTIGMGLAAEKFGESFFANSAMPSGLLTVSQAMSPQAVQNIYKDFWQQNSRARNRGLAILGDDVKYQAIGIPPNEAQFLENRKFTINEIARWFRLPPHMLGDLERSTHSNIEHQSLEFVIYSMLPWLSRWEAEMRRKLLNPGERRDHFFDFMVDGLLRGDISSRYTAHQTALTSGWKNVDEVRADENLNPLPNGQGQIYYHSQNMIPVGSDSPVTPVAPDPSTPQREKDIASDVSAEVKRCIKRSHQRILESARSQNQAWLSEFGPAVVSEIQKHHEEFRKSQHAELEDIRKEYDAAEKRVQAAVVDAVKPAASVNSEIVNDTREVVVDSLRRMMGREIDSAKRAAGKPKEFVSWLDEFYAKRSDTMADSLRPSLKAHLRACGGISDVGEASRGLADEWVRRSREDLLNASGDATADTLQSVVDGVLEGWSTRPETF